MSITLAEQTLSLNLAATLTDEMVVTFPKCASPKYDGIRVVGINGQAYSRNMKLIPNLNIQAYFADGTLDGLDGELICGPHDAEVFKRTSSIVRSIKGSNAWHFKVFDKVNSELNFAGRLQELREHMVVLQYNGKFKVSLTPQAMLLGPNELLEYETQVLADGYEGVMLRNPSAMYKEGRSTANSQDLLKVKRFADSEAIVIGWLPLVDINGTTKHDVMGSLQMRDTTNRVAFSLGSGFNAAERKEYALTPPIGQVLTYQYFAQGAYEKPRFPTFKGFRPSFDLPSTVA